MSTSIEPSTAACSGYCRECDREHQLGRGNATTLARRVMREFRRIRRLDYRVCDQDADPELAFEHLFPGEPGNMFGVLECLDTGGETVVLRAFSSLRRGIRDVEGWVPPILSAEFFYERILPEQQRIERLTAELADLAVAAPEYQALADERKRRSQQLFEEMQSRYRFRNFRGQERALRDAFLGTGGIPGGVGECCAPKLLDHAARRGLRPVGLAEFYWGGSKGSRDLVQGEFYPSCERRCRPILGFMLCGLDDG